MLYFIYKIGVEDLHTFLDFFTDDIFAENDSFSILLETSSKIMSLFSITIFLVGLVCFTKSIFDESVNGESICISSHRVSAQKSSKSYI